MREAKKNKLNPISPQRADGIPLVIITTRQEPPTSRASRRTVFSIHSLFPWKTCAVRTHTCLRDLHIHDTIRHIYV